MTSGNPNLTMDSTMKTEEDLDFILCGCTDFPLSGVDCSTRNTSRCFRCRFEIVYFTGESINDFNRPGHITCRILAIIIIILSIIGIVTNSLVIKIIQKRTHKRSFDFLLCTLSYVDIFCCLSCISYGGSHIAYYDNLFGRGELILYWLIISSMTMLLWRVMSMYLTLVITLERYLAIASPLHTRACSWFTLGNTKWQTAFVTFLVSLVILPGYFRLYVGPNIYGNQEGGLDVPSLREFQFIFLPTRFDTHTQANDAFIYVFQYWIPVPALLFFNILTYRKVRLLSTKRQQLTTSQRRELQPALMFIPIVVIFLCTNIWPMIMLSTLWKWGVIFREVWLSFFLATAVNSSVNFWIYYFRGTTFRAEVKSLFTGKPVQRSVSIYTIRADRSQSITSHKA